MPKTFKPVLRKTIRDHNTVAKNVRNYLAELHRQDYGGEFRNMLTLIYLEKSHLPDEFIPQLVTLRDDLFKSKISARGDCMLKLNSCLFGTYPVTERK